MGKLAAPITFYSVKIPTIHESCKNFTTDARSEKEKRKPHFRKK